jgi:hypothetical protein
MALIACPACGKRISSQALQCQHCKANLEGNLESLARINHIKHSARLMNHSFIAMTLFIGGVVLWFWGGEPAQGMRAYVAGSCFGLGFVGYLITRIRIVLHKRKSV